MNAKKTPLYDWHVRHGANMVEFTGYELPMWYTAGMKEEHLRVLTSCGMFDTSHMSVVRLTGPDIFELLQWCFTKDLTHCIGKNKEPLTPGRCTYGVFLNEAGGVVDDVVLFQLATDVYLAVVNAGMGKHAAKHILNYIDTCEDSCDVVVSDMTDKVGKIDIQGPYSARIMQEVLAEPDKVLEGMIYYSFKGSFDEGPWDTGTVKLSNGTSILLSRSGYTGEFGFEVFVKPENLVGTWELIMAAGEKYGILPCGLAARDSLRGGAVMPLSHQDNGNWRYINNPWPIALPYNADKTGFTKDFLGAKALAGAPPSSYTLPYVGYDVRKITSGDSPAVVVGKDGTVIGIVLTCVTDMGIGRHNGNIYSITSPDKPAGFVPGGLSCGFVKVKYELSPGEIVTLRNARREIKAEITTDIRPGRTAKKSLKEILTYTSIA